MALALDANGKRDPIAVIVPRAALSMFSCLTLP